MVFEPQCLSGTGAFDNLGLAKNGRCRKLAASWTRIKDARCGDGIRHQPVGRRREAGFTLIDILFVIAILGLLASMAIPGLMRARGAAQASSALGTMRVVNSAQLTFAISCGLGFYSPDFPTLGMAPPGNPEGFLPPELSSGFTFEKSGYIFSLAGTPLSGAPPTCNGLGAGMSAPGYAAVADPIDPSVVTAGTSGRTPTDRSTWIPGRCRPPCRRPAVRRPVRRSSNSRGTPGPRPWRRASGSRLASAAFSLQSLTITSNLEPRTSNLEPRTRNPEPGTPNPDPKRRAGWNLPLVCQRFTWSAPLRAFAAAGAASGGLFCLAAVARVTRFQEPPCAPARRPYGSRASPRPASSIPVRRPPSGPFAR